MSKTTYAVTGPTAFMGHAPGEQFDADLDPDLERRAKERGSIRVVKRAETKDEEKEGGDNA